MALIVLFEFFWRLKALVVFHCNFIEKWDQHNLQNFSFFFLIHRRKQVIQVWNDMRVCKSFLGELSGVSSLCEHWWNSVWTVLWFTREVLCVFVYVWRVTWRPMAACLAVSLIQCCIRGTDGAAESRLQQQSSTDRGAPHSHLTTTLRSARGTRPHYPVCLSVNHSPCLLKALTHPTHTKIMNFFIIPWKTHTLKLKL